MTTINSLRCSLGNVAARHAQLAFFTAIPIAVLGGLIGLGGAEFRLPVLASPLRYSAKQAVPLNLAISLITLLTALVIRSGALSLGAAASYGGPIVAMTGGAMLAAFFGATLAGSAVRAKIRAHHPDAAGRHRPGADRGGLPARADSGPHPRCRPGARSSRPCCSAWASA